MFRSAFVQIAILSRDPTFEPRIHSAASSLGLQDQGFTLSSVHLVDLPPSKKRRQTARDLGGHRMRDDQLIVCSTLKAPQKGNIYGAPWTRATITAMIPTNNVSTIRKRCVTALPAEHHAGHVGDPNSPISTVRLSSSLHVRRWYGPSLSSSARLRPLLPSSHLRPANMSLRTLALRPVGLQRVFRPAYQCRNVTDDKSGSLPVAEAGQSGPNMKQAEHVSEEAAKMAKITGGEGPDLEQGTPVQEILKDEKDQRKQAPQIMKDSIKKDTKPPTGTRSFSTLARRQQEHLLDSPSSNLDPSMLPSAAQMASYSLSSSDLPVSPSGHKFPLPTAPFPATINIKTRQEPIVLQFTNSLMRHGKKATAQRHASVILTHLRTAPAPSYNPSRPLLPGAPPASHLPLHPTLYLQLAIDSLAPLLRIKAIRGAAGGGQSLQVPTPLNLRQRRRAAIQWILDAASKRKTAGSGNDMFALKVAAEIVSVVEGRSALWDRRAALHKLGTSARANLIPRGRRASEQSRPRRDGQRQTQGQALQLWDARQAREAADEPPKGFLAEATASDTAETIQMSVDRELRADQCLHGDFKRVQRQVPHVSIRPRPGTFWLTIETRMMLNSQAQGRQRSVCDCKMPHSTSWATRTDQSAQFLDVVFQEQDVSALEVFQESPLRGQAGHHTATESKASDVFDIETHDDVLHQFGWETFQCRSHSEWALVGYDVQW
nr:37s ribosomal protein s7, mitochondrial [Quercus suber]